MKGASYERCTGAGGYAQRCVHPHSGRQAQTVGRERPSLRRLGDLPSEGLARRPESAVRVAVQRRFGQVIQRSCDGGKTWETPGGGVVTEPGKMPTGESNKFVYDASPATGKPLTTHQWY